MPTPELKRFHCLAHDVIFDDIQVRATFDALADAEAYVAANGPPHDCDAWVGIHDDEAE